MLVPIKAKESELYFYEGPSEANLQKMKNTVQKLSSASNKDGKEILYRWFQKIKEKLLSTPTPNYS